MISKSFAMLRLKRLVTMKWKAFVVLALVLILLIGMTGYAVWETIILPLSEDKAPEIKTHNE